MDITKWANYGDVNPEHGALLFRNMCFDSRGCFEAECIDTVSESEMGGDECRHRIRQGALFLAPEHFAEALKSIGGQVVAGAIQMPETYAKTGPITLSSDEGLTLLALASHSYNGMAYVDIESWVQIGKETAYDADHVYKGELNIYRKGTSLWSAMVAELDGFSWPGASDKARPYKVIDTGTMAMEMA